MSLLVTAIRLAFELLSLVLVTSLDPQLSPRAIGHWLLKGKTNKRQRSTCVGGFVKGPEEARISDSREAEAIRQAQRGEANAFELLYRLHSSRVFALCLRMLKNNAEAEDLTQETFLSVFRAIGTFRGHSSFSSWLHRVAINCVLMHLRRKAPAQVSLEETSEAARNPAAPERSCATLICD